MPASLAALAQGATTADDILSRFISDVAARGLSLYAAQEEAILELVSGKHVILATPTGSGKSLVATALHFKAIAEGKVSFYTAMDIPVAERLAKAFEAKFAGIGVRVERSGSERLYQRI